MILPVKARNLYISVGAFLLPVFIMIIVYIFIGIYPFGEKSLLTIDLQGQYISYFSYLKDMMKNGFSFYSFSKNMGGDLVGLSNYYLNSPFNFIFVFFKTENLPDAVLIITLLKTGFCGFTMNLFLNRDGTKGSRNTLLFSTAFALMAYNIVYQQNIMWLDGVILLPIIIWGIENIIKKTPLLYLTSLSSAIIINYYIGFMLCLFSLLYYLFYLIFIQKTVPVSLKNKDFLRNIKNFGIASLLSGGIAAFIMLPVLASFEGTREKFSLSVLSFRVHFTLPDFISKFYNGCYSSYTGDDCSWLLPQVYCGSFIILFCILYFTNAKIQVREKIGSGLLLLALVASFNINTLNLIWHGFAPPVWFPWRYSFVFCFILIVTAYRGYQISGEGLPLKKISLIFIFTVAVSVFLKDKYEYLSNKNIIFTILILLFSSAVFFIYIKKNSIPMFLIVAGICFADLGVNAYFTLECYDYGRRDSFTDYIKDTEPVIDYIKKSEEVPFYRIEKTFLYNLNDPMLLHYNGLSHYSSTEKIFVRDFLGKLGLRNNGIDRWATFHKGSTIAVDSLLGIKYLLAKEPLSSSKPYQMIWEKGDIKVWHNPYALPIGFMVGEAVLGVSMMEENLFELQNNIFTAMTEKLSEPLFYPAEIKDILLYNVQKEEKEDGIHYVKQDKGEEAFIEYVLSATEAPLYASFSTKRAEPVELFVNNELRGDYFASPNYATEIIDLGRWPSNQNITFRMKLKTDDVYIDEALFYQQDMNIFQNHYNELIKNPYIINQSTVAYFDGEFKNFDDKEYILFSIPYEENWRIRVNGISVPTIKIFDALLAVKVPSELLSLNSTINLTLQYIPQNLYMGIGISFISGLLAICWIRLGGFKK